MVISFHLDYSQVMKIPSSAELYFLKDVRAILCPGCVYVASHTEKPKQSISN